MPESLPPPHPGADGHPDYPWSTEVAADGGEMRHPTRDAALVYAADLLATLPEGSEVLLDRWHAAGPDCPVEVPTGAAGAWVFDAAYALVDGRLVRLGDDGSLPASL